jgi:hypothetical protein
VDDGTLTFTTDADHPMPSGLSAITFMDTTPLRTGSYALGGVWIDQ